MSQKENILDTANILSWEVPQDLESWHSFDLIGYDFDNCPVFYSGAHRVNHEKVVGTKQEAGFAKYMAQKYEMAVREARKSDARTRDGHPVKQFVYIVEVDKLSGKASSIKGFIKLLLVSLQTLNETYPDCVKWIYIVNARRLFSIAYTAAKSALSGPGSFVDRVQLYNSPSEWMPLLVENLPEHTRSSIVV